MIGSGGLAWDPILASENIVFSLIFYSKVETSMNRWLEKCDKIRKISRPNVEVPTDIFNLKG